MADGYRRRELTAASTLVPAACGRAGGMPCIPAARGSGRKLLGIAMSGGRQLCCGWPRKTVESAFQMADQRGKVSGLIRQPLTNGKTSCGGVRMSLRAGGGACSCR
uniref:OSJNBb0018J12.7 protein n=1 Tax=Oryza sativa subsp. japonica TaxID=39947 RepID=Q7XM52_ORYSJ|nr:OSJNBb0018J12.7 [Oryza sativa Japonica Group]